MSILHNSGIWGWYCPIIKEQRHDNANGKITYKLCWECIRLKINDKNMEHKRQYSDKRRCFDIYNIIIVNYI